MFICLWPLGSSDLRWSICAGIVSSLGGETRFCSWPPITSQRSWGLIESLLSVLLIYREIQISTLTNMIIVISLCWAILQRFYSLSSFFFFVITFIVKMIYIEWDDPLSFTNSHEMRIDPMPTIVICHWCHHHDPYYLPPTNHGRSFTTPPTLHPPGLINQPLSTVDSLMPTSLNGSRTHKPLTIIQHHEASLSHRLGLHQPSMTINDHPWPSMIINDHQPSQRGHTELVAIAAHEATISEDKGWMAWIRFGTKMREIIGKSLVSEDKTEGNHREISTLETRICVTSA